MSEKERNQLKRGRVQGSAYRQSKKPLVGEITDPAHVLNDSISAKGCLGGHQKDGSNRFKPRDLPKTTTVEDLDPLLDHVEEISPNEEMKETTMPRHHQHYTKQKEEHCSNMNTRNYKSRDNFCNNSNCGTDSTCDRHSCCCGSIKRFFGKILKFLGLKSSCCSKEVSGENKKYQRNRSEKPHSFGNQRFSRGQGRSPGQGRQDQRRRPTHSQKEP